MTLNELIAGIEKRFDCRDGEYGRFATGFLDDNDPLIDRLRYRTIGFLGSDEASLIDHMRLTFEAIAAQVPPQSTLYWRFAKEQRIALEECSEESQPGPTRWLIRTRVAIPDCVWKRGWATFDGDAFPIVIRIAGVVEEGK